LNHFYEKLLKLKGMMYTSSGKKLAEGRHNFLMEYLKRFYQEWKGEK
ncbi:MAG TPA: phosphohydrolase, partial [Atribacterota bacterium]|nr:phosphohydrolase [Atribacterota bacterium]